MSGARAICDRHEIGYPADEQCPYCAGEDAECEDPTPRLGTSWREAVDAFREFATPPWLGRPGHDPGDE